MNGKHHEDLTRVACYLADIRGDHAERLVAASSEPDRLSDVLCSVPLEGKQPVVFGRQLTSLQHFQGPDGRGYRWSQDRSLGCLEEIGDAGMHLTGMVVSGTSAPMVRACQAQPEVTLGDFVFPSAASLGSYYSTFPASSTENGYALHLVQDSCIPHHAWGCLLWGHAEFETAAEHEWYRHRQMLKEASDPALCAREFREQVAAVGVRAVTVADLIASNADWACRYFGQPVRRDECSAVDTLAVCIRAVAATKRALEIMAGGLHDRA